MSKRLIYAEDAIEALAKELKGVFVEYRDIAEKLIGKLPSAQPQLDTCPIYGGMCGYPSNLCYECPRHEGAKERPQWWTEGLQPFAQPQRMKGRWYDGRCLRCGEHAPFHPMASAYYESNFCPNCGADMRGEQE